MSIAAVHRKPQSIVVILNPAAGRGTGRRMRGELARLLADEAGRAGCDTRWSIVETTSPESGRMLAAEAALGGATVVAAAGGDGTYGEIVNGLVGTGARLGIIPLGTGNDFARGLGIGTDLALAVRTLIQGTPRPIDLGRCGERWFINVAGCGFDAVVAERVNRGFRYLRGTTAYVVAVYQSLVRFRAARMRLRVDGEERELRAMLCSIANSQTYGGGLRIAPDAQIDDGLFDICVLGDATKWEFLCAFPKVFRGTHVTHPKVTILRGRVIEVETEPPLPVLIDGDVVGATPARFEVHPRAIEVMAPQRKVDG